MRDDQKAKAELLQEVETLRRRIAELKQAEGRPGPWDTGKDRFLFSFFRSITKRKKAEKALQESEQYYRGLVNCSADVIWRVNLEGVLTFVSPSARDLCGFEAEELIGAPFEKFLTEAGARKAREFLERRKRGESGKGAIILELAHRRKDGTEFLAEIRSAPIFGANGEVVGIQGITRDITRRKQAEEELEAEQGKLYSLLDALPAFVYLQAPDYSVRFANRYFREHFGEPEGKMCYEVLWRSKEPCKPCPTFKVFETKKPQVWEWSQSPDGRIYEIWDYPFADVDGSPLVLELGVDITERKQAEEELQKSEQRYRSLTDDVLDSSKVGIFILDKSFEVVWVNQALERYFGLRREEVIGKDKRQLIRKRIKDIFEDAESFVEKVFATYDNNTYIENFECHVLADGQREDRWLEHWSQPIRSGLFAGGRIEHYTDITERKKAEEELSKYREKIAHAEQLASLGTLSATLAHRLNSPLTAIRLSIENSLADLATTSCPDIVTEELKDGLSGVSDAALIVERFRNFARKSSEEIVSEVNLEVVAEKIVKLLSESARRAKVSLHLKGMDELPSIYSNEKDLEQLFYALIENAIQAADGKKSRQLIISGDVKDEHIELRFADNCRGIAPENLDKIFEPFFTTRPAGEGTGLGLCVVEHIVSRAGGKVRVASKAGEGSTFLVTLPINKSKRP